MNLIENIKLALEGLKTNKMRALLTMLGIIIGIGSVIAIVTVGDSMTASISSSMQSLGATNIMVLLQQKDTERGPRHTMGGNISEEDLISDDMIDNYLRRYGQNIVAMAMSSSGGAAKAREGKLYANVSITGTNDGYALVNNIKMLEGRFLKEGDIKSKRYTAVVSDKLVNNMFRPGESPLGKEIKISNDDSMQTYTIVGVYKYENSFAMGPMTGSVSESEKDIRTNFYIPITTCNIINSIDNGYQAITVMASGGIDSVKFAEDTKNFLNTYYKNNAKYEINAVSMETMMSTMTSMLGTISIAVAVIAGISLLVGGIGVMNIMLVSVTERTREIGTRKALGARKSAIRAQFIVEAVIICAIGGIIGILTGMGLGYIGSVLLKNPGLPSFFIVIIALLFSMFIGIFFGYYPANKAAKLDPIEALRYE